MIYVLDIITFGVLGLIVLKDIRDGKIPNILLVILLINLITVEILSISGSQSSLILRGTSLRIVEVALITGFLFPFFSIGAIGAGDLKLISLTALFMNKPLLYFASVFSVASILALAKVLVNGNVRERVGYLNLYLKNVFLTGNVTRYTGISDEVNEKVSYCVHLSVPVLIVTTFGVIVKIT